MADLEKRPHFEVRQIDLGVSGLPLPSPPGEQSNHRTRQLVLAIAATAAMIIIGIATQKWGAEVPNSLFVLLCLIPVSLWFYWVWNHEKIQKYRRRMIYTYPTMSLVIMVVIGAVLGGGFGALLWGSVRADNRAAALKASKEALELETNAKKPAVGSHEPLRTPELVKIPGGKFVMGSPDNEPNRYRFEGPRRTVNISPFSMGKFEVLQSEWQSVVTTLPKVKIELNSDPSTFKGDSLPVEGVSWEEAVEFCDRLSQATGHHYRLPTEAEWEYACRARTKGAYAGKLDEMGWYNGNADGKTHPFGGKKKNSFGLYDMHGNVWEWCLDPWRDHYHEAPTDGSMWEGGDTQLRVNRGGSYLGSKEYCRSAVRNFANLAARAKDLGFRVVVDKH